MSVVANVAINVDAANAIQQLNRVKTATDAGQKSLVGASTAAKGLGTAMAAALGPILGITTAIGALGKAMQVFQDRQTDIAVLRNGLTGLVDDVAGVSEGLRVMADEFGKVTLFSEEDFMQGAQMLTSFRDIAVSSYQEVIGVAGDVAQVMGTDVNSSLLQLAKALQDPVAGLTALSRSGIQFNESQKETIKSMVEAGNAAGAQALILGELKTQYGGAAAAAGSAGFAGAMDTLAERTNDAFEILGKALDPALKAGVDLISAGVQTLADWWSYLGDQVFPKVQAAVQPVVDALRDAFEGIDFDVIRVVVQSVLIKGFEIAIGVIRDFSNVLAIVINGFKELSQTPVFQFIAEQVGNLANMLGLTNDKVGEYKKKQEEAADAAKGAVNQAVNLSEATKDAAMSADELKKKQQETLNIAKIQNDIKEQTYQNEIDINKALGNNDALQSAILGKIQQGYMSRINELDIMKSQGKISNEQHGLESELAALKRDGAKATAEAEEKQRKHNEQLEKAKSITEETVKKQDEQVKKKVEELQKQKEIAGMLEQSETLSAQNADNEKLKAVNTLQALQYKREQVELEYELATAGQLSNSAFTAAAEALRDAKLEAIGISENLQRAVLTAERLAGVGLQTPVPDIFGEAGKNQEFINAYLESMRELDRQIVSVSTKERMYNDEMAKFLDIAERYNKELASERRQKASMDLQKVFGYMPFANGGYVTKPTNALIGEGGESEYVIPSSKMSTAMANYAAGKRGASILSPQVNISTGPVMQMDGTNYVTMNDLQQATSTAARQGANLALSQLQSNPTVRRQIGVAR